jgi:hypothetical protein
VESSGVNTTSMLEQCVTHTREGKKAGVEQNMPESGMVGLVHRGKGQNTADQTPKLQTKGKRKRKKKKKKRRERKKKRRKKRKGKGREAKLLMIFREEAQRW